MSKEYELLKTYFEKHLNPEDRKVYLGALKKLNKPSIDRQIIHLVDDLCDVASDLENRLVDFQQHDKTWQAADGLEDCIKTINDYIEYVDNYESDVIKAIELGKHIADSDGINW